MSFNVTVTVAMTRNDNLIKVNQTKLKSCHFLYLEIPVSQVALCKTLLDYRVLHVSIEKLRIVPILKQP